MGFGSILRDRVIDMNEARFSMVAQLRPFFGSEPLKLDSTPSAMISSATASSPEHLGALLVAGLAETTGAS